MAREFTHRFSTEALAVFVFDLAERAERPAPEVSSWVSGSWTCVISLSAILSFSGENKGYLSMRGMYFDGLALFEVFLLEDRI